jgi:hypothetical protein
MIEELTQVYVVLGIDENEHDQVLAVLRYYEDAKEYCLRCKTDSIFYDLWIEKHLLL